MEAVETMSIEAYLALDAESDEKHELLNGVVFAMAGASPRHNAIASNLVRCLGNLLEGRCRVLGSDQRVRADATSGYMYPDVTVTCSDLAFTDEKPASLTNPTLVIEVLSASTWMRDMSYKLAHYRRMASVQHILFVGSAEPQAVHYRRTDGGWLLTDHGGEEAVELSAVGVALPLADVYRGTDALPT
ncbi:MAG TPA: Uma2 family endonuclease [Sandaracinaceae bacterium LLY-WYZ-13_1]|nr:Uma2 family endonuclease [Sandaracinaceae bacterium LLY-WYZ-13_1]